MQPAARIAARVGSLRSAINMRGLLSTEYTQAAIGQGLHLVFAGDYHKLAEEAGVILDRR